MFPIGLDGSVVVIYLFGDSDAYGVVTAKDKKICCLLCHHHCRHAVTVEELIQSDDIPDMLQIVAQNLLVQSAQGPKVASPMGISWKRVPFDLSPSQKELLRVGIPHNSEIQFSPADAPDQCPSCGCQLSKDAIPLPFITMKCIRKAFSKSSLYSELPLRFFFFFDGDVSPI